MPMIKAANTSSMRVSVPNVGTGTPCEPALPAKLNTNNCVPALQFSVPTKEPATALLNDTTVEADPPATTGKLSGLAENGAAGATQVTVASASPGFWNKMVAVVAGLPSVCVGVVTVLPVTGVEVSGTAIVSVSVAVLLVPSTSVTLPIPVTVAVLDSEPLAPGEIAQVAE